MISLDKQYRTRDGKEAKIYSVNNGGDYPVHGAVKFGDQWYQECWTKDGYSDVVCAEDVGDLIEVKKSYMKKVRLDLWKDGNITVGYIRSPIYKDIIASKKIEVTFTEGEFDNE